MSIFREEGSAVESCLSATSWGLTWAPRRLRQLNKKHEERALCGRVRRVSRVHRDARSNETLGAFQISFIDSMCGNKRRLFRPLKHTSHPFARRKNVFIFVRTMNPHDCHSKQRLFSQTTLTGWALWRRRDVFPVSYELHY
jgi:hypothetical protein